MAISNDTFFQYKEGRALSGYKSAWLVKEGDFYSLVCASESVPYVFGDKETFEYDLLQSPTKGQVQGKMSLEAQDIEVLHHRDNAYRFEKLKGKTLDFLVVNAEFVGYKFNGTLDYRPNNAEADVNKATVTITPMSASVSPIFNARPLVQETLAFANSIPETVKKGKEFDLSVVQDVTATVTAKIIPEGEYDEDKETDATSKVISSDIKNVNIKEVGLYALTVSATGYAPWTTTVYVEE